MENNNQDTESSQPQYIPEKELFAWTAKSRPFKKRSREHWVTIVAIASLLSFIMFLAEGTMPVILVVSVVFLYYILSTVEPNEVNFKITDKGIRIADSLTEWQAFTQYWFVSKLDSSVLSLGVNKFPGTLEMVVNDRDIDKIKSILSKHLPEEEPQKTSFDKMSDWVSTKVLKN